MNQDSESDHTGSSSTFAEFFTFPQYAISSSKRENSTAILEDSMADIEVIMVESHANIKIRSQKRPKQLLKLVKGLQSLRLTILHLNVTTSDQIVLYSLSVKVGQIILFFSPFLISISIFKKKKFKKKKKKRRRLKSKKNSSIYPLLTFLFMSLRIIQYPPLMYS